MSAGASSRSRAAAHSQMTEAALVATLKSMIPFDELVHALERYKRRKSGQAAFSPQQVAAQAGVDRVQRRAVDVQRRRERMHGIELLRRHAPICTDQRGDGAVGADCFGATAQDRRVARASTRGPG